jgi:hypothetical protein
MILTGTTAGPSTLVGNAAQGLTKVTSQVPADSNPLRGFSAVGTGAAWAATPGPNFSFKALGTVTTTTTVDWSLASYFTLTLTAANTCVLTHKNFSVGQLIRVKIGSAGTSAITWTTGTTTWLTGSSGAAPTTTTYDCVAILICTQAGNSPTFDGWYYQTTA